MNTRFLIAAACAVLGLWNATANAEHFRGGQPVFSTGRGYPATYYGRDSLRGSFYRGSGWVTTPGHYAYPVGGVYRPSYGYPYIGTSFYRIGNPDGYYIRQRPVLSTGVGL